MCHLFYDINQMSALTTLGFLWVLFCFLHLFYYACVLCGSGFKSKDGVPQMVKAYLEKKVKLDEFITHNMTLNQVNDAIELMKHGKW